MNIFRDLVIRYLRRKDEIVYKKTGIHLMYNSDYLEAGTWTEGMCQVMLNRMNKRRSSGNSDGFICPWCALNLCGWSCAYAKRHGHCDYADSTYDDIMYVLKQGTLLSLPAIRQLVHNTLCEYYSYLTVEVTP